MSGRTTIETCRHGVVRLTGICAQCTTDLNNTEREFVGRVWVEDHPDEAVAQLVADGVLVPSATCGGCEGAGVICAWGGAAQSTCPACEGSGKAESWYRLVLPEEGEDS